MKKLPPIVNTSHLTKARHNIVNDAICKGYNAHQVGNKEIYILKGKTCKSRGVIIFEDGSIFRSGMDLGLVKKMTVKDTRKHLRLD